MATQRVEFTHDGHRFRIDEQLSASSDAHAEEPEVAWQVYMDGEPVLEFAGAYPYRDEELRRRMEEWYALQRPVR